MRRQLRALAAIGALAVAAAVPAAHAAPATHETFTDVEPVGPITITDLPCFEGREFTLTGTVATVSRTTRAGSTFHFDMTETFDSRLVPVDGQGPIYVEHGVE